ncbi:MAG: hypothetical protein BGP16_08860 [Sphingobium sp. 66-54]|nr:MAG: hypothetical protein BGP16_08860 [Sphingobium sp. 66-54]
MRGAGGASFQSSDVLLPAREHVIAIWMLMLCRELGRIDIQFWRSCKWRLSVLPVLTDPSSAALQVTDSHPLRLAIS